MNLYLPPGHRVCLFAFVLVTAGSLPCVGQEGSAWRSPSNLRSQPVQGGTNVMTTYLSAGREVDQVTQKLRGQEIQRLGSRLGELAGAHPRGELGNYRGTQAGVSRIRLEAKRRDRLLGEAQALHARLSPTSRNYDATAVRLRSLLRQIETSGQRLVNLQNQYKDEVVKSTFRGRRRNVEAVIHSQAR